MEGREREKVGEEWKKKKRDMLGYTISIYIIN